MRIIASLVATLALVSCGGGGGGGSDRQPQPPTNRAPVANTISALMRPGAAASGILSATDADGDALSFAVVAAPANGIVILSGTGNQDFEYTPNAGFTGVDTFTFNATDGSASSNTANATMTVNTPPNATPASYTTSDIGTISGTISASDPEGDSLTFAVSTPPAKGTVTSIDATTGNFIYTPNATADGADTFTVIASDAAETSTPATISIEIFDWVGTQQFGTSAIDSVSSNGHLINDDGSHIQGGITFGQIGSMPSAGASDNFLRRTDRRGNQTSMMQFGDAGENSVRGLFRRPQGDGFYLISYPDGDNVYRFNNDGTEVYSVPLTIAGGTSILFAAYWAAVDEAGDLYILSWVTSADPSVINSGLVSKVNGADGTLIWHRELPTSIEDPVNYFIADTNRITPYGVGIDSSGNAVISGGYWDTSALRACSRCGFIAKLDSDTGANIWLREPGAFTSCGIDGSGRFTRVTVAPDDTLYVNGTANANVVRGTDGFLTKFSADGTQELWQYCDNSGADTTAYNSNPLITTDGGIVNFGNIADETAPGVSDLVVDKFDVDGNVIWQQRIEGTKGDGTDARLNASAIVEDSQGILYISGSTDGELTSSANAGELDAFVIRLGPDGSLQ